MNSIFLATLAIFGLSVTMVTATDLSLHGTNLVKMFRDYLVDVEAEKYAHHLKKRSAGDSVKISICGGKEECGRVVQNFGILYDPHSLMYMCEGKNYIDDAPKGSGISCYDKSPSCKILRDEFSMCLKADVVKKLGCELTCGYCEPAPVYGS